MHLPDIDFTIHADAGEIGCGATDGNNPTGGKWIEEKGNYINHLKLRAIYPIYLAVKLYRKYWLGKKHIKVKSNNTIVINNMEPAKLRALCTLVPYVLRALCASGFTCLVPHVLSCLTCLTYFCTLRVLCLACSRAARASNSTCSCVPRPSLPSGISSLTCSYASHVL